MPLQPLVEELLSLDSIHDSSTCTAESIQHRGACEIAEVRLRGTTAYWTYRYLVTARELLHDRLCEVGEPKRSFSAAWTWGAACEFAARRQLPSPLRTQTRPGPYD